MDVKTFDEILLQRIKNFDGTCIIDNSHEDAFPGSLVCSEECVDAFHDWATEKHYEELEKAMQKLKEK